MDLLLKSVIFVVTWVVKTKIIIAVVFIMIA